MSDYYGDLPAALDSAARLLPRGWSIELSVEQGAAWVALRGPLGEYVELPDATDISLADQILAAANVARQPTSLAGRRDSTDYK
jgi:hypothetical protein